jgi:large subunit ribosomal protein L14
MIQVQSILKIADNSGGRIGQCIRILNKSRAKTAEVGDIITISVKKSRPHRKIKKKDVCLAVILRTKHSIRQKNGFKVSFGENACALLTDKKDKSPVGTRIFGPIPINYLRDKGFMKCVLLARSSV